jgi:PPE-repeat protein
MDFAALPPEINSARMFAGPGSGPMLAAAVAWDDIATELHSAAASYVSVVNELTSGPWLGPTSASMAAAAAAHVQWFTLTAGEAEQTATQARAAAGAYEAAFAMTVAPPVIAANRALLMSLLATNLFAQNSAAIATTEAQYSEMWAQDAVAMYSYAAASASAARLAPFTSPAAHTKPSILAGSAGAPAATNTQPGISGLMNTIYAALTSLSSPTQTASVLTGPTSGVAGILQAVGLISPLDYLTPANTGMTVASLSGAYAASGAASQNNTSIATMHGQVVDTQTQIMNRLDQLNYRAPTATEGAMGSGPGVGAEDISASSNRAAFVGGLSVPQGWTTRVPAMRAAAFALPATNVGAVPYGTTSSPGNLLSDIAFASGAMVGRPLGAVMGSSGSTAGIANRLTGAPSAPPQGPNGSPWVGVAAELLQLASLHESGILTDEEFSRQKRRLLGD